MSKLLSGSLYRKICTNHQKMDVFQE